jgi:hypothetical protein
VLKKLFLHIGRHLLLLLNSVRSFFYFKPIQKGQHGQSLVQFLRSSEILRWVQNAFNFDGSHLDLVMQLQFLHCTMPNFPLNEHVITYIPRILYYIMLHYITIYYIVLYCIILYYIILYYIILYCIILYYIILYFRRLVW